MVKYILVLSPLTNKDCWIDTAGNIRYNPRRCSVIEMDVNGEDLCRFLHGFVTYTEGSVSVL